MRTILSACLAPLLALSACVAPAPSDPSEEALPAAGQEGAAVTPEAVARSNRGFALALYRTLAEEEQGNLFFSPLSLATAFGPVAAGAAGETRAAIVRVLHFPAADAALHPALAGLGRAVGREEAGATLTVANGLWVMRDYALRPDFQRVVRDDYGATVERLDFAGDPRGAARRINAWVDARTRGRIPTLVAAESFDETTRLVVTNAVYFLADWQSQFRAADTAPAPFTLADGRQVQTPMMHQQQAAFRHHDGGDFAAIDLPYRDPRLSMTVLLPDTADGLPALERRLTPERLDAVLQALDAAEPAPVDLRLPKLELRTEYQLKDTLTRLGMGIAFTNAADFSGITQAERLAIDSVVHKTFLRVDEKGTEAAAATAIEIVATSAPLSPPLRFHADRPFLFMLRDRETGAILFLGRIVRPEV